MSTFENAKRFFEACDAAKGWEACKQYVADNATFVAQSEPLAELKTVEDYCEWMKQFGTVTVPGATYDLHTVSYDDATRKAVFFATFHARHTGDGGPIPPTNRETHTDYVYVLEMDSDDEVSHMTKVWNSPRAMGSRDGCSSEWQGKRNL